jgi:hypothetical protein
MKEEAILAKSLKLMVGTTGEPQSSKTSNLQPSVGEIASLKRNGYFERRPHLHGLGADNAVCR